MATTHYGAKYEGAGGMREQCELTDTVGGTADPEPDSEPYWQLSSAQEASARSRVSLYVTTRDRAEKSGPL